MTDSLQKYMRKQSTEVVLRSDFWRITGMVKRKERENETEETENDYSSYYYVRHWHTVGWKAS